MTLNAHLTPAAMAHVVRLWAGFYQRKSLWVVFWKTPRMKRWRLCRAKGDRLPSFWHSRQSARAIARVMYRNRGFQARVRKVVAYVPKGP